MEGRDFSAYVVIYDSDENTNRSTIQMSNICNKMLYYMKRHLSVSLNVIGSIKSLCLSGYVIFTSCNSDHELR